MVRESRIASRSDAQRLVDRSRMRASETHFHATPAPAAAARPIQTIVPVPSSMQITPSDTFTIDSTTAVVVASGAGPRSRTDRRRTSPRCSADRWRRRRERCRQARAAPPRSIALSLDPSKTSLGLEGYDLGSDACWRHAHGRSA